MDEKDYVLIERFLQGETSPEENAVVTTRRAEDPAFAAALAGREQLNAHLRAAANEEALVPILEQLGQKYFPGATGTDGAASGQETTAVVRPLRQNRRWLYGVLAAAVVALAVLLGGPWLRGPAAGGYEQFAQHQPLSLTERSDGPDDGAAAETAFNDGRYAEAIPLLEAYLEQNADDDRARLALGVSLLETDRDEEAIAIFTRIANGTSALAPYGNWYLALAAVKRGRHADVETFLRKIPATDTYLTAKANELRATL